MIQKKFVVWEFFENHVVFFIGEFLHVGIKRDALVTSIDRKLEMYKNNFNDIQVSLCPRLIQRTCNIRLVRKMRQAVCQNMLVLVLVNIYFVDVAQKCSKLSSEEHRPLLQIFMSICFLIKVRFICTQNYIPKDKEAVTWCTIIFKSKTF